MSKRREWTHFVKMETVFRISIFKETLEIYQRLVNIAAFYLITLRRASRWSSLPGGCCVIVNDVTN
eukprot:323830-Pyramimonas_sp.AAC.3